MPSRRELMAGVGAVVAVGPALAAAASADPPVRERSLLDAGWRFALGHAQDPARDFGFGANQSAYAKAGESGATPRIAWTHADVSAWREVDLPHDWAVELPFAEPAAASVPKKGDDPRAAHGFKPIGRDFPETSVGWYRRSFELPASDRGRRISLEFDGVFRDALVFVNGYILARNESGYAPFRVDITDVAAYGGTNVVAVRADASQGEGWFYEGAGIYRHVWLVKTAPVHVPQWGAFVRAELSPDHRQARLAIATEIANEGEADAAGEVVSTILGPDGKVLAVSPPAPFRAAGGEGGRLDQTVVLQAPALWSLETPQLHELVTELRVAGQVVDRVVCPFGVRSIRFDAQQGFFLNDAPVKLKGTCNHQDHAGVGSAIPDRLQAFRIERLKAMGSNAYRTSHNPPTPELLDACDRLGMLVMDETRRMSSDPTSLDELARMVRRDHNHPSVILWSIGNEEPQQGLERGARVAATMKRLVNRLDGSRLVTEAMDNGWGQGVTPVLDVMGFNYRTTKIDDFHARFPNMPVLGSETGSTVTTRGVYERDAVRQLNTAYDREAPWWATTAEGWWPYVADRAYIAGGFVWTGFDYRGEPTPFGRWPSVASYFGILDNCGFAKDAFYYYKAWWDPAPSLHLFPHWTWPGKEGQAIDVWCYSNLDEVELLVNGASQGRKSVARNLHVAWSVPYAPGAIEARGFKDGRLVMSERQETTGPAARLALTPDRALLAADGRDLAVVTVSVLDAHGRAAPWASDEVAFTVSGPGRIIGVGNGDPTSHEPDKASSRRAFGGLAMALVQTTGQPGPITVTATAANLRGAEARLRAAPPA